MSIWAIPAVILPLTDISHGYWLEISKNSEDSVILTRSSPAAIECIWRVLIEERGRPAGFIKIGILIKARRLDW